MAWSEQSGLPSIVPHSETLEHLYHGDHIPFAILNNALQVVLFVIYFSDHTTIDIFLGRWDAKHMGQKFQGGVMLEIAKFPEV